MKLHLIKKTTVNQYMQSNVGSRNGLKIWFRISKGADWLNTNDILKSFTNADILGGGTNRVVSNIGGNKYRIVCGYPFGDE